MKKMIKNFLLSSLVLTAIQGTVTLSAANDNNASTRIRFDILILDGSVYRDGHTEAEVLDIGITDDRITFLGEVTDASATQTIDASGLLVVPGFIDTHNHDDDADSHDVYLLQGVTTIVAGNCGRSLTVENLASAYDEFDGKLGTNYIGLVGHNQIRRDLDLMESELSEQELQQMKDLVKGGMEAGAFGLSTGLIYRPGYNSTTEEIIELAKVAAEYDGLYASHIRNEGPTVLDAVEEAIRIGKESGTRVQISHVKCAGPAAWGLSEQYIGLVEKAVSNGQEVWMDQYPYAASQTTINAVIPDWAESDWESVLKNKRDELEQGVGELIAGRGGAERVYMVSGPFPNRFLSDVAASLKKDAVDVVIDDVGLGGASAVYHMMQEEDVKTFMKHPRVMVGSDGPTKTHPRGSGSFPRFWGHYGRDLGVVGEQSRVLKTSTLAAEQFRLIEQNRGRIDEGFFADLTILDPGEIIDEATFEVPTESNKGVEYVIVNGRVAVENGENTGALAGRVLRSYDSR